MKRRRFGSLGRQLFVIASFLGAVLLILAAVSSHTTGQPVESDIVQTLTRGLQHREQLVRSVYMVLVKEAYGLPVPNAGTPEYTRIRYSLSKVRLWADGNEFYQEELELASSSRREGEECAAASVDAFDGTDRYSYFKDPNREVRVYSGGGGRGTHGGYVTGDYGFWFDVMYHYAFDSHQVLSTMVREAHPESEGTEEVEGVACYKVVATRESGDRSAWWIAPDRGYVCLKLEIVNATDFAPKRIRSTYTWSELEKVGEDLWFPRRARMVKQVALPDGTSYRSSAVQFSAKELMVNPQHPLSPVSFTLPLNAPVLRDGESGGVVGGNVRQLTQTLQQGELPDWVTSAE